MNSHSVRTFVVLASVLAASACGDSPTQSTTADISVSLSSSRAQIRSGESTTFTTSVVNNGGTAVFLAEPGCVAYFEVVSGPNVVAPGQPICAAVSYGPITLAPGETRQFAEVWHGENRTLAMMLSSGMYSVRANVHTTIGAVMSTPIAFQILP